MKTKQIILIAGGAALAYGIYGAYQMSTNSVNVSDSDKSMYSLIGIAGAIAVATVIWHPHYEKLTSERH